jgi:thioredoxin 1
MIRDVTDRDFPREVEQASMPVLVEFWQPGCGHCLALLKQLEQLQEEVAPVLKIVKMNVQENFQIPAELEIRSLPALALFERGEFVRFIGGIGRKDEIRKQLGFDLKNAPGPSVVLDHAFGLDRPPRSRGIFRQPAEFLLSPSVQDFRHPVPGSFHRIAAHEP